MTIMNTVKREQRIKLLPVGEESFEITSMEDAPLIDADTDFFIYMKNVNLRPNGSIQGRMLGENPVSILDEHCKEVKFSVEEGKWLGKDGKQFTSARMVAVNNKTGVSIIIQNN